MKTTQTYSVDQRGRKVRVTVPENPDPKTVLKDALRDCLSPEAVAAVVSWLQPARTRDAGVNRQLAWFQEVLVETLGGHETCNRLCEELGL